MSLYATLVFFLNSETVVEVTAKMPLVVFWDTDMSVNLRPRLNSRTRKDVDQINEHNITAICVGPVG